MTITRTSRVLLGAALCLSAALGSTASTAIAATTPQTATTASTALAQRHGESSITARVSNPTPAAGEEFVVRGNYVFEGLPAGGHAVKVQTYRDQRWINIEGARVTAQADGDYRVRVVLFIRGVRDLRVVGISGTPDHPNSHHRFVVEVTRH